MANKCPKCDFENPEETFYCGKCASPLPSSKEGAFSVTKTLQVPIEGPAPGSTFAGRYKIIKELGQGGMGKVYRALDIEVKEEVALKLIRSEIAKDEAAIERFRNELKVARKVSHRNVCRMHDLGAAEEGYYITMEYVEGEDLKSHLQRAGKLAESDVISLAKQVCEGLKEAHELGVIHRDMKPQNIMVEKTGRAKIMDFGIARLTEAPGFTATGVMIGTPDYISPEQAEGQEADQRSDLYSLGVILYEMVTGCLPFEGDTAFSVALKHKSQLPPDPRKLNPEISENLSRLILICMEKQKERRYQTAEAVLNDLRNIDEGLPLGTKLRPRRATFVQTLIRKKAFVPALIVVLAVIAVGAYFIFRNHEPDLDPNRIVVAFFDNQTGDPKLDPIGRMVADQISLGLEQTDLVKVVPSMTVEWVHSAHEGENPLAFLAQKTNSGTVVSGRYYLQGNSLLFHAQVTDARKEDILQTLEPVSGPVENALVPIESVKQAAMISLSQFFDPEIRDSAGITYMPSSYEAYEKYLEGRTLFVQSDMEGSLEPLLRAAALDPSYAQPRILASVIYHNSAKYEQAESLLKEVEAFSEKLSPYDRYSFDQARAYNHGDNFGVYQAATQRAQLVPYGNGEKYQVGEAAVAINRAKEAVEVLSQVDPEGPGLKGWFSYWGFLTQAHHLLGDHKKELKEARRARKQYPDLNNSAFLELRALAALGKIEELNEVLDGYIASQEASYNPRWILLHTGRELRAHGYRKASLELLGRAIKWLEGRPEDEARGNRSWLALILSNAERWEESQAISEELAEEYPDSINYLGRLGALAARRGDRAEALRISSLLEADKEPYRYGRPAYYRACIASLLGEKELAVNLLKEALAQGVTYIFLLNPLRLYIHPNWEFEPLYDYPPFQELMKPKG